MKKMHNKISLLVLGLVALLQASSSAAERIEGSVKEAAVISEVVVPAAPAQESVAGQSAASEAQLKQEDVTLAGDGADLSDADSKLDAQANVSGSMFGGVKKVLNDLVNGTTLAHYYDKSIGRIKLLALAEDRKFAKNMAVLGAAAATAYVAYVVYRKYVKKADASKKSPMMSRAAGR